MQVLNAGCVNLIEHMGGDDAVIRNARRCWRSEDRSSPEADKRLIEMLLRKGHMTPFESMVFTFDVKAPIFVARQWFRHRMGSFNEESLRYCESEGEFYRSMDIVGILGNDAWLWENQLEASMTLYQTCIKKGIPKEQARAILPMGLYTRFYWTVNGSSLINFLRLRMDKAAQAEIRAYAQAIYKQVSKIAPVTFYCLGEAQQWTK